MTFQMIAKSPVDNFVFLIAEHLLRLLIITNLPVLSDK